MSGASLLLAFTTFSASFHMRCDVAGSKDQEGAFVCSPGEVGIDTEDSCNNSQRPSQGGDSQTLVQVRELDQANNVSFNEGAIVRIVMHNILGHERWEVAPRPGVNVLEGVRAREFCWAVAFGLSGRSEVTYFWIGTD